MSTESEIKKLEPSLLENEKNRKRAIERINLLTTTLIPQKQSQIAGTRDTTLKSRYQTELSTLNKELTSWQDTRKKTRDSLQSTIPVILPMYEKRLQEVEKEYKSYKDLVDRSQSLQSQIDALKQEKLEREAARQASVSAIQTLKQKVTAKPSINTSKIQRLVSQVASTTAAIPGGPPTTSGASATPTAAARGGPPLSTPAKGGSMRRASQSRRHTRRGRLL
jgi:hypothetical protein